MSHFEISRKRLGPGSCEVRIEGEVDLAVADRLRDALACADCESTLVDLGACEFIDSTGIAVIVQAQQERGQDGGGLVVHSASDQVLRVLALTGLTENGLAVPSRAAALAAVGLEP